MIDLQKALDTPLRLSDAPEASTVREYFRDLLIELWRKEDGFSGKRPFGNSGWQLDLYDPLIRAGFINGDSPPDDHAYPSDRAAADKFIEALIAEIFVAPEGADT